MLTPRADDPNRRAELARQRREPERFGATWVAPTRPDDWKAGAELRPVGGGPKRRPRKADDTAAD